VIFVVEDDPNIRELVTYTLQSTGFEARGFENGSEFLKVMGDGVIPELVLLDIMLPGEDGISILGKLRGKSATKELPIIMMTAKGTEYDKVLGLDSGADDYITKPFGMMELVSRVKAVLRRSSRDAKEELVVGDLHIYPNKHKVKAAGTKVTLTNKEFKLLCLLVESKGNVLNRDQLLTNIWGYDFDGETRTVDVHIRSLRQKLGPCGNLIETVRGIGYRIGGNE
jgi:two-component system alkaline phosphatase synthesis response regulator PhoP